MSLQPDNIRVRPSSQVKSLSVIRMAPSPLQIIITTRTSDFHLPNITRPCPSPSPSKTSILINALVTSRLHHWHAPLHGPPHKSLNKPQNLAARIISRTHITPVLKQLHWLPVLLRIDFNFLFLTFKAPTSSNLHSFL